VSTKNIVIFNGIKGLFNIRNNYYHNSNKNLYYCKISNKLNMKSKIKILGGIKSKLNTREFGGIKRIRKNQKNDMDV